MPHMSGKDVRPSTALDVPPRLSPPCSADGMEAQRAPLSASPALPAVQLPGWLAFGTMQLDSSPSCSGAASHRQRQPSAEVLAACWRGPSLLATLARMPSPFRRAALRATPCHSCHFAAVRGSGRGTQQRPSCSPDQPCTFMPALPFCHFPCSLPPLLHDAVHVTM